MQTTTRLTVIVMALCLSGCVTGYSLVTTGVNSIDTLTVDAGPGWNLAPSITGSANRKNSQTWTQDGLLLNRLVFIPAVADGEALLVVRDQGAALPVFRKDMLPNDVEELAVEIAAIQPRLYGFILKRLADREPTLEVLQRTNLVA